MRKTVTALSLGLVLAASSVGAQQSIHGAQTMSGRAGSLNLGVPTTPGHNSACEHEDAEAAAKGWNLAFGLGVYRTCQSHVIAPERVTLVKPQYTPEALRAKIEGTVILAAVIDEDGKVAETRVLQSLDTVYGLDAKAIEAVNQSTFTPGRLGANRIKVAVIVQQQFVMR
jgi:TonB family protein